MDKSDAVTIERNKFEQLLDMAHVVTTGKYFLNPWKTVDEIPHPMIGYMTSDIKEYVMPKEMYEDMMWKISKLKTLQSKLYELKEENEHLRQRLEYSEDEEDRPRFKMDANGNLTRIED